MLQIKSKKENQCKKKDQYQFGLMFYTRDLGHDTNITHRKDYGE